MGDLGDLVRAGALPGRLARRREGGLIDVRVSFVMPHVLLLEEALERRGIDKMPGVR